MIIWWIWWTSQQRGHFPISNMSNDTHANINYICQYILLLEFSFPSVRPSPFLTCIVYSDNDDVGLSARRTKSSRPKANISDHIVSMDMDRNHLVGQLTNKIRASFSLKSFTICVKSNPIFVCVWQNVF